MKICVIGAPSTGKSVFARTIAAELTKQGLSCELIAEFASQYIQQAGAPVAAWEQLVISVGQYQAERNCARDLVVTDAAAFATYIYAQRSVPKLAKNDDWPKYRQLLDVLRNMGRASVGSYDVIFLLTHVFPPRNDGIRMSAHLSRKECQEIGRDLASFLDSERAEYHRLKANDAKAIETALGIVQQRALIQSPTPEPSVME